MEAWLNRPVDDFGLPEQDRAALCAREMPGLRMKGGVFVHALLADSAGDVSSVGATVGVCARKSGPRAIVDTEGGPRMLGNAECR